MKHFRRWLFTALAAISLVLCLCTVALWIRSYWCGDQWSYETNRVTPIQTKMLETQQMLAKDELYIAWSHGVGPSNPSAAFSMFVHRKLPPFELRMKAPDRTFLQRSGFRFSADGGNNGLADVNGVRATRWWEFDLSFPLWFATAVLLVLPTWRWIVPRFRKRTTPGYCPNCGYDLRATPDRCPECGAVPPISPLSFVKFRHGGPG